jgi:WD40 repeat protein
MLACGSGSGAVYILHLEDNRVVSLDGHQHSVQSVVFCPDGQFLASASDDYTLNIWETNAADSVILNDHHSEEINLNTYLQDGNFLHDQDMGRWHRRSVHHNKKMAV